MCDDSCCVCDEVTMALREYERTGDEAPVRRLIEHRVDTADARLRARPCPYITGRTTQWCALGQTTAEADRALARIGAMYLVVPEMPFVRTPLSLAARRAIADESTLNRARELAQEGQDG